MNADQIRALQRALKREKLLKLTDRYCVVYQTLRASPRLSLSGEARRRAEDQSSTDPLDDVAATSSRS